MSETIRGTVNTEATLSASVGSDAQLQASVAQGPVIINDYVIDLQEVPEGVQLTVRKGSEEQTALIPMGASGGASSWNDLTDRPFGESPTGGDTLTWDGNTEGLTCAADMFYKVSDIVLTADDVVNGATVTAMFNGAPVETTISGDEVESAQGLIMLSNVISVATEAVGVDFDGMVFNETGLYFVAAYSVCTSSLTIPGYTDFPFVKKIEEKYLPDLPEDKDIIVLYGGSDYHLYYTYDDAVNNATTNGVRKSELQEIVQKYASVRLSPYGSLVTFIAIGYIVNDDKGELIIHNTGGTVSTFSVVSD